MPKRPCRFCGSPPRANDNAACRCSALDTAELLPRFGDVACRRAERMLSRLQTRGRLVLGHRATARSLALPVARALACGDEDAHRQPARLLDCLLAQPAVTEVFASDDELARAIADATSEPPPRPCGAFVRGALRFCAGYPMPAVRAVGVPIEVDAFERVLCAREPQLPTLIGPAPCASWVLARLAALLREAPPLPAESLAPGAGYALTLSVLRGDALVAVIRVTGDSRGVSLRGDARDSATLEAVQDSLTTALLASPTALAPCELRVRDPDWASHPERYSPRPTLRSRARFGYGAGALLGADNPVPR